MQLGRGAWMAATIMLTAATAAARTETPPSPRIAALEKAVAAHERGAEDAFWQKLAQDGTPIIEDIHEPGHLLITFVWRADAATDAVMLVGPVSNRDERMRRLPGSSTFVRTVSLPDDARVSYAFIVNPDETSRRPAPGAFHHDPLSKHPYLDVMSLLELPHAPAQPSLIAHRGVATGTLWRHTIAGKPMPRQLFVYTPPGYSTHAPAYPLLVAFDAEAVTGSIPLPLILDELIAAKKIPPVVALFIGNVDRRHDLAADADFTDFVALDLVPWVRAHYHATSDPRRTVVSGMSLGGLASAYAAFRHPEVFGNVLSQSGSFWWGPEGGEPEATAHDYATSPRLPVRFWMEVGLFEYGAPRVETTQLAANRHLRDVLLARGYDARYREFAGDHSDLNWRGTIADGITALFATPPKSAAPKIAARRTPPRAPVDIGPATRSGLPPVLRSCCSTCATRWRFWCGTPSAFRSRRTPGTASPGPTGCSAIARTPSPTSSTSWRSIPRIPARPRCCASWPRGADQSG